MPPTALHSPADTATDRASHAPFDDAREALRRPVPPALLPVQSAARVWDTVTREFSAARSEQMPLRARMLDVLEHLNRGHMLALMGAGVPMVWLDGHHDIVLLAGVLFCYGYVEIAGRHRSNPHIVYFRLSDAGRRKLGEGRAWWHSLSLWQRLQVRVFG
jgi:hypothetical protein